MSETKTEYLKPQKELIRHIGPTLLWLFSVLFNIVPNSILYELIIKGILLLNKVRDFCSVAQ